MSRTRVAVSAAFGLGTHVPRGDGGGDGRPHFGFRTAGVSFPSSILPSSPFTVQPIAGHGHDTNPFRRSYRRRAQIGAVPIGLLFDGGRDLHCCLFLRTDMYIHHCLPPCLAAVPVSCLARLYLSFSRRILHQPCDPNPSLAGRPARHAGPSPSLSCSFSSSSSGPSTPRQTSPPRSVR